MKYEIIPEFIAEDGKLLHDSVKLCYVEYVDDYISGYDDGLAEPGTTTLYSDVIVAYDYLKNNNDVLVPVLYKTAEEYPDPDYETPLYYQGTAIVDEITYDKWRKIDDDYQWNTEAKQYIYTNVIVQKAYTGYVFKKISIGPFVYVYNNFGFKELIPESKPIIPPVISDTNFGNLDLSILGLSPGDVITATATATGLEESEYSNSITIPSSDFVLEVGKRAKLKDHYTKDDFPAEFWQGGIEQNENAFLIIGDLEATMSVFEYVSDAAEGESFLFEVLIHDYEYWHVYGTPQGFYDGPGTQVDAAGWYTSEDYSTPIETPSIMVTEDNINALSQNLWLFPTN